MFQVAVFSPSSGEEKTFENEKYFIFFVVFSPFCCFSLSLFLAPCSLFNTHGFEQDVFLKKNGHSKVIFALCLRIQVADIKALSFFDPVVS